MRDTERDRDIGRVRIRLPVRNLMQDLIPGPGITIRAKGRCSTTEPLAFPVCKVRKQRYEK